MLGEREETSTLIISTFLNVKMKKKLQTERSFFQRNVDTFTTDLI